VPSLIMLCGCNCLADIQEYSEGRLVRQLVLAAAHISAISSSLSTPPDISNAVAAHSTGGRSSRSSSRQQVTPLGDVLYQDHSAYDLMVQLQLGVRYVDVAFWCRLFLDGLTLPRHGTSHVEAGRGTWCRT
jgi:hypothetical protein